MVDQNDNLTMIAGIVLIIGFSYAMGYRQVKHAMLTEEVLPHLLFASGLFDGYNSDEIMKRCQEMKETATIKMDEIIERKLDE